MTATPPAGLPVAQIEQALRDAAIGHRLVYVPSLPSTMPLAHQLVAEAASPGHCAGLVVVADEQTAGRGRLDRRWETPPGRALLTSIIVAPPLLPPMPAQLPMIGGLAMLAAARTVAPALAPQIRLKWPNDLLIMDEAGGKKAAGLLIESVFDGAGPAYAVLGIGINANQRPAELPAPRRHGLPPTSLYAHLGHEISRPDLLIALCRALDSLLAPARRPPPAEIHQRWQAALVNLGQRVAVYGAHEAAPSLYGRAVGTTDTGSLIVEDNQGERQIVEAGDAEFHWDLP